MTTTPTTAPPLPERTRNGRLRRVAAGLAGAWSIVTLALGLLWTASDRGYPWREGGIGLLSRQDRPVAASVLVALSALAIVALAAARATPGTDEQRPRWPDRLLLGLGIVVTVFVADAGGLALLGYLPMILGSLVLGSATDLQLSAVWSAAVSLSHTVGGIALLVTAAARRRVAGQACTECGRLPAPPVAARARRAAGTPRVTGSSRPDPEDALQRWGVRAVVVAAIVPLVYAATRIAWFVGVPLGVSPEMLEGMGDLRWSGLGLAGGATVGAVLTTGLVSRWGEVFPSWVPWLGGRPVPIGLAVGPAVVVAAAVTSAGVSFVVVVASGDTGQLPATGADWGAWLPTVLWPLWGVALFIAAMAYRARRRPACAGCGSTAWVATDGPPAEDAADVPTGMADDSGAHTALPAVGDLGRETSG
ncbi:hypothetical protein [Intrasporangium sp.]|uniref:hypothetical protein n=1 Tax=Intrasporangium sp. TaxID=1925024 RepID=UPI00293A982C|nr:hypothetical protein [Intrasporangium sp.]MDV3220124.1 hypothetical protein [Intrasporangium sp.]